MTEVKCSAVRGQCTKPAGPKPRLAAAWATAAHRARRGKEINSWRSRVSHLGKTHANPSTPGNNDPSAPRPASTPVQKTFMRSSPFFDPSSLLVGTTIFLAIDPLNLSEREKMFTTDNIAETAEWWATHNKTVPAWAVRAATQNL